MVIMNINAGISLPSEMLAKLKELAAKEGVTVSKLVQRILGEIIEAYNGRA